MAERGIQVLEEEVALMPGMKRTPVREAACGSNRKDFSTRATPRNARSSAVEARDREINEVWSAWKSRPPNGWPRVTFGRRR